MAKKTKNRDYRRSGLIEIKVYKNMVVTYREFFEAIEQLGYKNQSSDTAYKFAAPKGDYVLAVAKYKMDDSPRTLDDKMLVVNFFNYSQDFYWHEEIKHPDDLAKMIEKNREKAKEQLTVEAT